MSNKKQSEIKLNIELDQENIPEKIHWTTTDTEGQIEKECKAFILSIWDTKENNALRLDLWTKEMNVAEMNIFFFETLMTMAETYERATNNTNTSVALKRFAREFGEKTEILKDTGKK